MKRFLFTCTFHFVSLLVSYGATETILDILTGSADDVLTTVSTNSHAIGQAFTTKALAGGESYVFTPSNGASLTLRVSKAGSETVTVGIFSDAAGDPGALLTDGAFDTSSINSTLANRTLSLSSGTLTLASSTTYWVVYTLVSGAGSISWDGADGGTANTGTGTLPGISVKTFNGAVWSVPVAPATLDTIVFADLIPEPSTWAMIFTVLGAVGVIQYRRKQAACNAS